MEVAYTERMTLYNGLQESGSSGSQGDQSSNAEVNNHSTGRLSNMTLRGGNGKEQKSQEKVAIPRESGEEFEGVGRIIRSGWLYKRAKATKKWSRRWFVLRADQLVYYKDESEYKVEGMISTADIMSVTMLADQKPNHFALFTNNKNFHLQADNTPDAQAWVDVIRHTANEAAESILCSSFERLNTGSPLASNPEEFKREQVALAAKLSSPTTTSPPPPPGVTDGIHFPKSFLPPTEGGGMVVSPGGGMYYDYSGTEDLGMSSCTSEGGLTSPPKPFQQPQLQHSTDTTNNENLHLNIPHLPPNYNQRQRTNTDNNNEATTTSTEHEDGEEKIVKKGYILRLKKRYNQWRRQYVILTDQKMEFFKNEKNKTAVKELSVKDIIDVVEIDPLSRTKRFCMQLITDNKRMRFCAESEEDLTKWLASLKSVITKS